jgi:hypothetical protein
VLDHVVGGAKLLGRAASHPRLASKYRRLGVASLERWTGKGLFYGGGLGGGCGMPAALEGERVCESSGR